MYLNNVFYLYVQSSFILVFKTMAFKYTLSWRGEIEKCIIFILHIYAFNSDLNYTK